jgi:hypothetical protein
MLALVRDHQFGGTTHSTEAPGAQQPGADMRPEQTVGRHEAGLLRSPTKGRTGVERDAARTVQRAAKQRGNELTTAEIAAVSGLSDDEHARQLRRALIASTVGTTVEWYDFLLYGQVTGLVFGKLFFPQSAPMVGVLQAFAVFSSDL